MTEDTERKVTYSSIIEQKEIFKKHIMCLNGHAEGGLFVVNDFDTIQRNAGRRNT